MAKSNMNLKAFAGVVQSATQRGDQEVPVDLIDIKPQVRTQFNPEKQASINASIAAQGINQSLVLHAKPDGRYDLVAGEYRIRGAFANGLKTVPARVKHSLSAWEIRRIQVSENMEREDITAFDEAMGVSEDVNSYGFEVAQQIWNRSEGWISKRTAVLKYAEPVRKLLQDGISNDLEVAHSLNQLHQLSEDEYSRLEKALRAGVPLSREEVRSKVKLVREWQAEQKQRNDRRQALDNTSASTNANSHTARSPAASPESVAPTQKQVATARTGRQTVPNTAAATANVSASSEDNGARNRQPEQRSQFDAAPAVSDEQAAVLEQMVSLFQNSVVNYGLLKDVQAELNELGADMNQTEWAMWSLFQTIALPVIAALGETRAQRYLQRTIAELRTSKPQDLWNNLHPAVDAASTADWTATRTPVAPMPKDWRF